MGTIVSSGAKTPKSKVLLGSIAGCALLILLWVFAPFMVVGPGQRGVLLSFGAVTGQPLAPGLHFIMPIRQSVVLLSTRVQRYEEESEAASLDLQTVNTTLMVNWSIQASDAGSLYQSVGNLLTVASTIVAPSVWNVAKATTAQFNAEELVSKRAEVAARMLDSLRAVLAPYHILVEAVNITNFQFSKDYSAAIEAKQVAQQQALQATYTLQEKKVSVEQKVVEAQAQAQAHIEQAKGIAAATLLRAKAQATANAEIAASLTPILLQQKALDRWSGRLPTYLGSGAPIPFLGTSK